MADIEKAMNPTTEEAIKYLEYMMFQQDFSASTLKAIAINKMSIQALREKAEREVGCEWCNGEYDTRIVCHAIRHHTSNNGTIYELKTYFCPNCGRDLRK